MPEDEYRRRLENQQARLERLSRSYRRLWLYFFACIFFCVLAASLFSWRWVILSALALIPICRLLKTTQRDFSRTRRVVEFYELGMARFANQWQGRGADGQEFEPESHVYSADLNLFGKGSVFELLSTARTGVGRATLASGCSSRRARTGSIATTGGRRAAGSPGPAGGVGVAGRGRSDRRRRDDASRLGQRAGDPVPRLRACLGDRAAGLRLGAIPALESQDHPRLARDPGPHGVWRGAGGRPSPAREIGDRSIYDAGLCHGAACSLAAALRRRAV